MSPTAEKIEGEFRNLSEEEMVALSERLIESIHEKAEARGLDPDFKQEIQKRVKEIDEGKVEGEDAFKALEAM